MNGCIEVEVWIDLGDRSSKNEKALCKRSCLHLILSMNRFQAPLNDFAHFHAFKIFHSLTGS